MKKQLEEVYQIFETNYKFLVSKFKVQKDDVLKTAAAMFSYGKIVFSEEKFNYYREIVLASQDFGAKLRPELAAVTMAKMALSGAPEAYFDDLQYNYKMIYDNAGLLPTRMYLCAITMTEHYGKADVNQLIEVVKLYRKLLNEDPFLVHTDDIFTGALLDASLKPSKDILIEMERVYDLNKTLYAPDYEALKFFCAIMAMTPGVVIDKSYLTKDFFDKTKASGCDYSDVKEIMGLGIVPLYDYMVDELFEDYREMDKALEKSRILGKDIKVRRMYALILAGIANNPPKDTMQHNSPYIEDTYRALWVGLIGRKILPQISFVGAF